MKKRKRGQLVAVIWPDRYTLAWLGRFERRFMGTAEVIVPGHRYGIPEQYLVDIAEPGECFERVAQPVRCKEAFDAADHIRAHGLGIQID